MAQRPIWKGHLRLALVSCPVAFYTARHDRGAIRFNMINPVTGNRIRMVSLDAETGEEIARRDTVKGYEFQKNRYLLLDDADFDSVKVETTSTMMVEKFVDADSIDPIYYDTSYYVAPNGKEADDVYAVLREAIQKTGKVALTRVVIAQRERTVAIRPMKGGLVAHTLNEQRDLNSAEPLFEEVQQVAVDPDMVQLAVQLVARQTGKYDPADLEDRYETRLRAMLDAKLKGEGLDVAEEPTRAPSNVIDLMAALKKSLGEASKEAPAAAAAVAPVASDAAKPKAKRAKKAAAAEDLRSQPSLKLPIEGGRKARAAGAKQVAEPEKASEAPPLERAARSRRRA